MTYYDHGDGFRWVILLCGLAVFLTVLRIGDGDGRRSDWVVLGLSAGVGWLSSHEIAYFLGPYFRGVAGSRAPAWIFVSPSREKEAAAEAGSSALDPGCTGPNQACLSAPELVDWCVVHHIGYTVRHRPYEVVLPTRRVLPRQVLPFFGT